MNIIFIEKMDYIPIVDEKKYGRCYTFFMEEKGYGKKTGRI